MEINQEMHLEKVNKFNAEGYLIHRKFYDVQMIKNILDEVMLSHHETVRLLQERLASGAANPGDLAIEAGNLKYLKNADLYFPSVKKLADSNLNALVSSLLADNVFLDAIELHQKYPGGSITPPHQDNFYFCLKDAKSLTAYIPLNRQSEENGALAVVPRSHKSDLDHFPSDVIGFSSGVQLNEEQRAEINHYALEDGDLSIHHCNIVHLAPANISDVPRVNIAIRYRAVGETKDPVRVEKYTSFLAKSVRVTG